MARPLTADQLVAALRKWQVPYREYAGWRERGMWRIAAKGWAPVGLTIHHTAGGLGSRSVERYIADIINGDPAVPDKANVVVAPDGTLWLNAAGRANHHLYYGQTGYAAITRDGMPTSGSVNYRGSLQNFNAYSYGVECIAAGVPNDAQRDTAVAWAAAVCDAHGRTGGSVCGHGELASDRDFSDPGWDMGDFRRRVNARLKAGPGGAVSTPPAVPAPAPAQVVIGDEGGMFKLVFTGDGTGHVLWADGRVTVLEKWDEEFLVMLRLLSVDQADPKKWQNEQAARVTRESARVLYEEIKTFTDLRKRAV